MRRLFIVIFVCFCLFFITGCWITTEHGEHNGQITAIEKNGLFWKTWDVYIKSDISSSQEEYYCVEDYGIVEELKNASKTRSKVTLYYHSELVVAPWRCTSSDIIDSVVFD